MVVVEHALPKLTSLSVLLNHKYILEMSPPLLSLHILYIFFKKKKKTKKKPPEMLKKHFLKNPTSLKTLVKGQTSPGI